MSNAISRCPIHVPTSVTVVALCGCMLTRSLSLGPPCYLVNK